MDWNSKTPSEWDWENLALFSCKAVEIPKQVQLTSHEIEEDGAENGSLYSSAGAGFSGSDLGYHSSSKSSISASPDSSLKKGMKTFSTVDGLSKVYCQKEEFSGVDDNGNFSTLGASENSGDPMIGLKLGKRTYFEDMCAASTSKNTSFSVVPTDAVGTTTKKPRASYHSTQNPRCQVEGCNLDLKSAKDYHRRHRICENHSKSPRVIVAGMERRFCQQCSRQFDDKKRSCRRRLSDHNARRRRPRPEAIHFNSVRASSLNGDGRHQMNFLLNRDPTPVPHHTWQNACNLKIAQSRDSLSIPAKTAGIDIQPHLSSNDIPNSISMLRLDSERISSFHSATPRVLYHDLVPPAITSNLDVAPELRRALSLLSTNSWGFNEPEPTSLEHFIQVNQSSAAQPMMHAEPQNVALASSSQYMRVEQPTAMSRVHSLGFHSNGNSQFQEFQFIKAPYDSGCFYPNHIN
ncbi:hypothetical protein U1Q18_026712 [Sarracenia purpurea var. burkii]